MIKIKPFLLILLICCSVIGLNACNTLPVPKQLEPNKKTTCNENSPDYGVDIDKYNTVKMLNYNIEIKTNNIISKTTFLKSKLAEIKDGEMESFSSNENSANIRMYYPLQEAGKIDQIMSKEPEITSFSRNDSNIGQSYVTYAKRYYSYKALLDSFDEIKDIIQAKSCDTVDINTVKKLLEENTQNNENNMTNYKKQMNKLYLQIYIRKANQ